MDVYSDRVVSGQANDNVAGGEAETSRERSGAEVCQTGENWVSSRIRSLSGEEEFPSPSETRDACPRRGSALICQARGLAYQLSSALNESGT